MEVIVSPKEKIREFIAEVTFTTPEEIKDDTLLFEQGLFDSLGFLILVSHINEEYEIEIADGELNQENFESVNAIVNFLEKKDLLN